MERVSTTASIVVTITILALTLVKGQCPSNVESEIRRCTAIIMPDLSFSSSSSSGPASYRDPVAAARDMCRDSRVRDVAACLQAILDKCKGTTEQEQVAQRLLDKEKIMNTVEYFCSNIPVLERHAKCIVSHHDEVNTCSQNAKSNFNLKLATGAMMDTLIIGSCRFHAVARECLTNTTESHCGREASTYVFTLLTGHMPPYCQADQPEHTTRSWFTTGDHSRRGDTGRGGVIVRDGSRGSYDTEGNSGSAAGQAGSVRPLVLAALGFLLTCLQGR